MKIPISKNDDPFLGECIALARGERLDAERLNQKIKSGLEPPREIVEYLARQLAAPARGRPRTTWREKSFGHMLRLVITRKFHELTDAGMTRRQALEWLAKDLEHKGAGVKSWRTWESYLLPRNKI